MKILLSAPEPSDSFLKSSLNYRLPSFPDNRCRYFANSSATGSKMEVLWEGSESFRLWGDSTRTWLS